MSLARALVSEAEFLELPETNEKIELLLGEVIVSPAPSLRHQTILIGLVRALTAWAEGRPAPRPLVGQAPTDIRFGYSRILQPDGFVFLDPPDIDAPGPVDRVPDLCIEVLSSNRAYDRITKRAVYADAGVKELWVVESHPLIERFTGAGLASSIEVTDQLTTEILPDFELSVASVYPGAGTTR